MLMHKNNPVLGNRYRTRHPFRMSVQQRCLAAAAMIFCMVLVLDAAPPSASTLLLAGDKLLRFFAFASLSILLYAALAGSPASRALSTLTLVGVMSGVDGAIQLLLPYHSANLLGWKFDMLAALTCVGMLMMLHPVLSDWLASQRMRPATIRARTTSTPQVHRRRNMQ